MFNIIIFVDCHMSQRKRFCVSIVKKQINETVILYTSYNCRKNGDIHVHFYIFFCDSIKFLKSIHLFISTVFFQI